MRQRLASRQQHGHPCDHPPVLRAETAGYHKNNAQVTSRPTRQKAANRMR